MTPLIAKIDPPFGPLRGGTKIAFSGTNLLPREAFQDYYDGWFSQGLDANGNIITTSLIESVSSELVRHTLLPLPPPHNPRLAASPHSLNMLLLEILAVSSRSQ